ncbi:fasciclin domain-containing protein [Pelomonas sp. Root1444]|uniref:fasciclin domain-containing protein n=1 Tax=Pelomonas sp. Root1444 TaxID=1736464 RepID=UPI000A44E925|nr:fasciclin domain-containing protein [Pelomonas sp. Root1444]
MTSAYLAATTSVTPGTPPPGQAAAAPSRTLMQTLHGAGHFNDLIAAIKATGLASPFHAAGPHTVFAPNDLAFGKLAEALRADLFKPEGKARLTAILRLHLVPRRVRAAAPGEEPATFKSLQGEDLVMHSAHGPRVNAVCIVQPDVQAANGVIHVIDTVLMPIQGG